MIDQSMRQSFSQWEEDWEYVLDDLLEMSCLLSSHQRRLLIDELRDQKITTQSVDVPPAFSIEGRVVVVLEGGGKASECWLYYPKDGKIEKHKLNGKEK